MASKKLTVVISQAQGKNPAKLNLEEELAAALIMSSDVDCSVVPHLYDMHREHTGLLFLRSVPGDLVILSWLYPRAARWVLDRQGVKGREGVSLLTSDDDEAEDDEVGSMEAEADDEESRAIGAMAVPDRRIYCIDLRISPDPKAFLDEIRRIAGESTVKTFDLMEWIQGSPQPQQLERYLHPVELVRAARTAPATDDDAAGSPVDRENGDAHHLAPEPTKRRWYPVIDYSRCTNCMECIDFCLFGVYGVDKADRILVELQDNCKKGCPACSRVCPENAIIFPGHKEPAIAGADGEIGGLKIDLSRLFGGDGGAKSALEMAVAERDTELVADGRDAVGLSVGIPKRQNDKPNQKRDDLDDLMDGLDDLDL